MSRHLKLAFVTFLTVVRLPLVLLFFAGAIVHAHVPTGWLFWCTFASLVLSALTDLFDGYYARKFNVVTQFGLLRNGTQAQARDVVRTLTGREPRTVAEFLRDHAGAFA